MWWTRLYQKATHIRAIPHSMNTVGTHVYCDNRMLTARYIQLTW